MTYDHKDDATKIGTFQGLTELHLPDLNLSQQVTTLFQDQMPEKHQQPRPEPVII